MSFFEGKNASVTWSAVAQPCDKYDIDFKSEIIDTSNMTSQGQPTNLAGFNWADASFGGPYNGSIGFLAGSLNTITFATGGGGPSFALPLRVQNIRLATAARNQVKQFTAQATSCGTFSVTY